MKRLRIILGTMAAIIVSAASIGCTEEINVQQGIPEGTITREFTASFAELTRTALEEGGKVSWCKGDTIWYYTENRGKLDYHIVNEDCKSANITVKMQESANFIIAFYGDSGIEYNYSDMLIMKGLAGIYQEGGFGDAHLSIAKCEVNESSELVFKNITSMIKFSLSRNDIHYVSITANDGTPLSHSEYFIDLFSDQPYIFPNSEIGENTIYVHTGGAGTFYIGLLPVIMEKGFNIECYNKYMQYIGTVRNEKQLVLSEREIVNLGRLDERIFNQEFRLYHIYGPIPTPPDDTPTEPDDDYTPIRPDSPDYQTDREHHIFGDSYGNIATVQPDKENGGYIFTFGGYSATHCSPENTIVAHVTIDGKMEYFTLSNKIFLMEYSEENTYIYYEDKDGSQQKYEITNPYTEITGFTSRDPVGIYGGIVSPIIDILGSVPCKDLVLSTLLGGDAILYAWDVDNNGLMLAGTIVMSACGILMAIGGSPILFWAAVAKAAIDISIAGFNIYTDHIAQNSFGNAIPVTLPNWKQEKEFSVTLSCEIVNKEQAKGARVGIIIGKNIFLSKLYNEESKLSSIGNEDVYTFTFSGLKPNVKYYYSAVLVPAERSDFWVDCWRYGELGNFTLSPDYGDEYITAVDLGLSVKWASCNLGATRPENEGAHYAWAEIETKDSYSFDNYKYADKNRKLTKYCNDTRYGKYDGLEYLSTSDDAAYEVLGGNWRTPSIYEWNELYSSCNWSWTKINGISGYLISGKKKGYENNSIFIPVNTIWRSSDSEVTEETTWGEYWTNKLYTHSLYCQAANTVSFSRDEIRIHEYNTNFRYYGIPIRAVLRK